MKIILKNLILGSGVLISDASASKGIIYGSPTIKQEDILYNGVPLTRTIDVKEPESHVFIRIRLANLKMGFFKQFENIYPKKDPLKVKVYQEPYYRTKQEKPKNTTLKQYWKYFKSLFK
jgi:hypothetical protein